MTTLNTTSQSADNYYLQVADDLRRVADRIADLAGMPEQLNFTVYISGTLIERPERMVPAIDRVAATFGATAVPVKTGGSWTHETNTAIGGVRVTAYTHIPAPEGPEVARLRAEVAALRAQLTTDGVPHVTADQ